MIYYLIVALHVIVCIILVLVVLLQSGKGADLAGAFGGGGSQTAFGSRGPASFLSKVTTAAAVLFMMTSLALSGLGRKTTGSSVLEGTAAPAVPAKQTSAPVAKVPAPSPDEIKRIQQEVEAKQGRAGQPAAAQATPAPAEKSEPAKTVPPSPPKPE